MSRKNRKTVNLEYLNKNNACEDGVDYWISLDDSNKKNVIWLLRHAINSDNNNLKNHANWLASRTLSRKNKILYAINAAELVLGIHENKHPNDDRPRKAIEAAKLVVCKNIKSNRDAYTASYTAADAAYAAAYAAYAADAYAAYAAAYAADAAYAAAYAAYAADAYAAYAAYAYAYAAAYAYDSRKELMNKCLEFAVSLYEGENNGN